MMRRCLAVASLVLATGCGAAPSPASGGPETAGIEALRAYATSRPNDPAAWRALAEGELLGPFGDPSRARAAIDRAAELAPGDAAVRFLSGVEHEQHARPRDALEDLLRAADLARLSRDALAPAIAEVALVFATNLRTDVPDFDAIVAPVVARLADDPGAVGIGARETALNERIAASWRRGDPAGAQRAALARGCPARWRVAGPFVPFPMLAFDRRPPASGRGPMADRYDHGPTIGSQPTRSVETEYCSADLATGPIEAPGVWVAETEIEAPRATDAVLSIAAPGPVRVLLDGAEIAVVDRRRHRAPRRTFHPVQLSAGRHELEVVLATRDRDPSITVAVDLARDGYRPASGLELPDGATTLGAVLRPWLAQIRGDFVSAREELRSILGDGASATLLSLAADVTDGDVLLPPDRRADDARRLFRRALERDPAAYYPHVRLAQLETGGPESLRLLREAADRWPSLLSAQIALATALRDAGFDADAETVLVRARELAPESCELLELWEEALRSRMRIAEANALADRYVACSAGSDARFELHLRRGDFDAARAELARLRPLLARDVVRRLEGRLALESGDLATRRSYIAADRERLPYTPGPVLEEADHLLAEGRRADAIAMLDAALVRAPSYMASLRTARRVIAGTDELERSRLDGLEVIRKYERSGRNYEGHAQVLVLDSMVVRVSHDGSSQTLVHQIHQVRTDEGVERLSQPRLAGRVLTLRVIKPDGRVLEPDRIQGAPTTLPSLAVGDYVEREYVTTAGPNVNGGFASSLWLFQSSTMPFDWSRFVAIVPRDMPLIVEATDSVPPPTERPDGDLRVIEWAVEQSPVREDEPASVRVPNPWPEIRIGFAYDWDTHFTGMRETLAASEVYDPAIARQVAEILDGTEGAPLRERVRRIRTWILENVEPGGGFEQDTARTIAARSGNRVQMLRYMLRIAGIPAEIVNVRSFGSVEPGRLARPQIYPDTVVMIPREGEAPLWVAPAERGSSLDYLPRHVRGQEGVVLTAGLPRVRLPDPGPEADLHSVSIDIALDERGGARIEVAQKMRGVAAAQFRQLLDRVPPAELRRAFEMGFSGRVFPNSALRDLRIEGREDPEAPLVLRYAVEASSYARRSGDAWLVRAPFPFDAASTYATLPARQTTQAVDGEAQDLRIRVRAARGTPQAIAPVEVRGARGLAYVRRSAVRDGTLIVERRVRVPQMLVSAAEYPDFAARCRQISEAEQHEIVVR